MRNTQTSISSLVVERVNFLGPLESHFPFLKIAVIKELFCIQLVICMLGSCVLHQENVPVVSRGNVSVKVLSLIYWLFDRLILLLGIFVIPVVSFVLERVLFDQLKLSFFCTCSEIHGSFSSRNFPGHEVDPTCLCPTILESGKFFMKG